MVRPQNFKDNDTKPNYDKKVETNKADKTDDEEKPSLKQSLISLGRDILIAVIVMVIIIGSLWGYTGNWPPMVVIESDSMMHSDDSAIGTIDTGDLVLVKSISGKSDIVTYVEGEDSGYQTYGSYGNVIIFRKNGVDDTPVIHRAVIWIEYNETGYYYYRGARYNGSFDIPSLPPSERYNRQNYTIPNFKPNNINIEMDFALILENFRNTGRKPHGGFLTKGDNNNGIDQTSSLTDSRGQKVEPVKPEWIVGRAEGELPWFGLIKLFITGDTSKPNSRAPPTSVNMLVLSIALIIIIPIILDLSFTFIGRYLKKKRAEKEEEHGEPDYHGREPSQFGPPHDRSDDRGPPRKKFGFGTDEKRKSEQDMSKISKKVPTDKVQRYRKPGKNINEKSDMVSKDDLLRKIK